LESLIVGNWIWREYVGNILWHAIVSENFTLKFEINY